MSSVVVALLHTLRTSFRTRAALEAESSPCPINSRCSSAPADDTFG
jgi:hypothetical protein